jgi:hypothetical protein
MCVRQHSCGKTFPLEIMFVPLDINVYTYFLALWHGMSSSCRWRRQPPDVEGS